MFLHREFVLSDAEISPKLLLLKLLDYPKLLLHLFISLRAILIVIICVVPDSDLVDEVGSLKAQEERDLLLVVGFGAVFFECVESRVDQILF